MMFGSSPLAWGIHLAAATKEAVTNGSSPLAWGIRNSPASHTALLFGSSPLAWGIHQRIIGFALSAPVHPHSRGVYVAAQQAHVPVNRFIPTRVGYTSSPFLYPFLLPVHPHSRGVYYMDMIRINPFGGSSPLAWGIPCHSWL